MSYALNAYAKASQSVMTPREVEAAALTKAAQRLQIVRDNWTHQSVELVSAIQFNQKLWTILATAATEPSSLLSHEIKQSVANLATFVFRRSVETIVEPAPEKLTAIISVNLNLAAGLSSR